MIHIDAFNKTIQNMSKDIVELSNKNLVLQAMVDHLKSEVKVHQQFGDNYRRTIEQLSAEKEALLQRVTVAQGVADLNQRNAESDSFRCENTYLRKENQDLSSQVMSLRRQIAAGQHNNNRVTATECNDAAANLDKLRHEGDLEDLNGRLFYMSKCYNEASCELRETKKRSLELASEVEALRKKTPEFANPAVGFYWQMRESLLRNLGWHQHPKCDASVPEILRATEDRMDRARVDSENCTTLRNTNIKLCSKINNILRVLRNHESE